MKILRSLRWITRWITHAKCDFCSKEFPRRDLYREPADLYNLCFECVDSLHHREIMTHRKQRDA